jgi:hypothetical protein
MGNLCHGRYLPVEVPADDSYGKSIHPGISAGIHIHINSPPGELEFSTPEPQVLCCVHKPQEMWDGKRELVEEVNFKFSEARGADLTNK